MSEPPATNAGPTARPWNGLPAPGGAPSASEAKEHVQACDGLLVFAAVVRTPAVAAVRAMAEAICRGDGRRAARARASAFTALAAEGWSGDAWRAHIAHWVASDGNAFTIGASPGEGLAEAARGDLDLLERLAAAPVQDLAAVDGGAAPWRDLGPRAPAGMARRLYANSGWRELLPELRAHGLSGGAGPFATHLAYRWIGGRQLRLLPVADPDIPDRPIVGYDEQRAALRANTERLLAGLPAQDVLLYGDRGTGKSSSVRHLLRLYGGRGLRLVELGRRLADLPDLYARLSKAPQRFIVFVDDLSFDDDDARYRDAKAALEGGIAARPRNVAVYATSNRRHLVRERLTERTGEMPDDPRAADAVEEKLSLADRFGLTLVFAQPDQAGYLEIVAALARRAGVAAAPEDVATRALRWAMWYNGRSGRTARQFVDTLADAPWDRTAGAEAGADPEGAT